MTDTEVKSSTEVVPSSTPTLDEHDDDLEYVTSLLSKSLASDVKAEELEKVKQMFAAKRKEGKPVVVIRLTEEEKKRMVAIATIIAKWQNTIPSGCDYSMQKATIGVDGFASASIDWKSFTDRTTDINEMKVRIKKLLTAHKEDTLKELKHINEAPRPKYQVNHCIGYAGVCTLVIYGIEKDSMPKSIYLMLAEHRNWLDKNIYKAINPAKYKWLNIGLNTFSDYTPSKSNKDNKLVFVKSPFPVLAQRERDVLNHVNLV